MTKKYYKCEETHQTVKGIKLKRCTKCERWKEISEFCKDHARKDGLRIYCKSCNIAYVLRSSRKKKKPVRDYLRYEDRHRVVRSVKEKLCSRCKKWKFYSDFHKTSDTKDGLTFRCKECVKKLTESRRKGARKHLRYEDRHRIVKGIRQKLCTRCSKWKVESEFSRNRASIDGMSSSCKECLHRNYRQTLQAKEKES